MSSQRARLQNGQPDHAYLQSEEDPDEHRQCKNCGAHVSDNFIRVFAGNDNVAHACPECSTSHEIFGGAAVGDRRE